VPREVAARLFLIILLALLLSLLSFFLAVAAETRNFFCGLHTKSVYQYQMYSVYIVLLDWGVFTGAVCRSGFLHMFSSFD
jgi:ABC-type antimicrobial peptide transport system permease subunit